MPAVISGIARKAVVIDGDSLKLLDVDDSSSLIECRKSDLLYLFGEGRDLRFVEDSDLESIAKALRSDSDLRLALDLTLISLDQELEQDMREDAIHDLNELIADENLTRRLEGIMYARPLPDDSDLETVLKACGELDMPTTSRLFGNLGRRQGLISRVSEAWDMVPSKTFGGDDEKTDFQRVAVQQGLFRTLVTLLEGGATTHFVLTASLDHSISQLRNSREALRQWLTIFRELTQPGRASPVPNLESIPVPLLRAFKEAALSDRRLAYLTKRSEDEVRAYRKSLGLIPVYKRVDTCGAEFESYTPYLYSTYEEEDEAQPTDRKKIMILGSGPNRIGQGIEFDYCCCHASFALHEAGYETIMVNCNPETVSTDYDTSDRLYFEPLTFEDVMNIVDVEKPTGVIVQLGGQTPLNLAMRLHEAGVPIIGTSPDSIDLAEDRKRFGALLDELGIPQPENGTATSIEAAREIAERIGYPVLVRPSYVLGGRAMAIVYDQESLDHYMRTAVDFSHDRPVLIDKFLEQAAEFDVDALADESACVIAGIQEHIEEAGIHSGDSSCVLPPVRIAEEHLETMRHYTRKLASALSVKGLMNIQFAIKNDRVYVLEVNPRASRTVPFVSKATGVPLARIGALVMAGQALKDFELPETLRVDERFYIKSPVFPFRKFPGVDPVLSPEMHSTGEVMGIGETFGEAYAKAMTAAGLELPQTGTAFISVNEADKGQAVVLARKLSRLGFELMATVGTAARLREVGLDCATVFKVNEGRPNVADHIKQGEIALVINTPLGRASHYDEQAIRRAALQHNVPCVTTMTGAQALVEALASRVDGKEISINPLQELHAKAAIGA